MKYEKFSEIADGIIVPLGNDFRNKRQNINWSSGWRNKTEQVYLRWVKDAYNKLNVDQHALPENFDRSIDRHKRGAAIALAILECTPLDSPLYPRAKNVALDHYPNEVLAIKVGLQVVIQIALKAASDCNDLSKAAYLREDFTYPSASDGIYCEHVYKTLYHANQGGKVDLLMLSNLLFMLESYNDQYKQQQAQPKN